MNKVVCNICGTSYPESATQCPICGNVQDTEKGAAAKSNNGNYTYVKGGRFSKANVKRRNQAKAAETSATAKKKRSQKEPEKSNTGSVIIVAVLLLVIIAMTGYIVVQFCMPNGLLFGGLDLWVSPSASESTTAPSAEPSTAPATEPEDTTVSLQCTDVQLNTQSIQLDGIGSTFKLEVSLTPEDTEDAVTYSSSDESVAAVSDNGVITAVSEGTAVITVRCGSVSAKCTVTCSDPDANVLTLNRKEITFGTEGQSWLLYNGDIPNEEIVWTSDDNNVATISDGKVVAVGEGDTTVSGIYKGQTATCIIHCRFEEQTQEGNSNISEATGGTGNTYQLYNPYGFAEDVTINPGDRFTLKLVDADMNEVTNAQWQVNDENICTFSNNVVEGKNSGTTTVTATYEGKTYTCVVRVN